MRLKPLHEFRADLIAGGGNGGAEAGHKCSALPHLAHHPVDRVFRHASESALPASMGGTDHAR